MVCLLRELLNDEVGTSALAGPSWGMGWPALEGERHSWLWWRYNVRWGRVSALRFHLCNLTSIVRDYYQLFNYSDDIYQGQLYRAVSCRENGLSVLLLHSKAGECAAEAVQVVETFGWTCFFPGRDFTATRIAINCPPRFQLLYSLFSLFIAFRCHSISVKHSFHFLLYCLHKFIIITVTQTPSASTRKDQFPSLSCQVMHDSIINKRWRARLRHPGAQFRVNV